MKRTWQQSYHWALVGVVVCLSVIGLVNLYSAGAHWENQGTLGVVGTQGLWMGIGLLASIVISRVDVSRWQSWSGVIYTASLCLLIIVLVWGVRIAGHQSWLRVGGLSVQPSEFAKVAFIVYLAARFARFDGALNLSWLDLLWPAVVLGMPLGAVLAQGDLGSALFFVLSFLSLLLIIGLQRQVFWPSLLIGLIGGFLGYFYGLSDYQKQRIAVFINPETDPQGAGYQLIQAKLAIGSGGWVGQGFLQGTRNKLLYLPEQHTDFVFPVWAEEWGFVGALLVVCLYLVLVGIGLRIASQARDAFGLFLAYGVTALLFWQVVINLGGVLGLLPLTGVTLPFLSYGGSSLVSLFIAIGLLQAVYRSTREVSNI